MLPSYPVKGLQKGDSVIKKCVLVGTNWARYTENRDQETPDFLKEKYKEELIMGLKNLFGWSSKTDENASSACGSACGAGDKPAEPSSACGATTPKPTA